MASNKNIYVLPTDKLSRIYESGLFSSLSVSKEYLQWKLAKNIYITNDEEIKEKDYYLDKFGIIYKRRPVKNNRLMPCDGNWVKKIILTTNQDLINDGVQTIDDKFLEWFVKNPSCEWVEVIDYPMVEKYNSKGEYIHRNYWTYKIIIPKEKLKIQCKDCHNSLINCTCIEDTIDMKQETLEEAAEKYALSKDSSSIFIKVHKKDFIEGAKWQSERMYSEKEVIAFGEFIFKHSLLTHTRGVNSLFGEFKKK